ncbi:hypothetical protein O6H91_09G117600 [Diphasiastrum complanatum]|uniref:Uncharacterized protein n=1 Tax=Diphasiastrum complanatum TaxID=34168 RepID=A0ACC2CTM9_DIPCM|nr:hypothetical protein O6H91_09G117600 [Diphasiastrum complanatum]
MVFSLTDALVLTESGKFASSKHSDVHSLMSSRTRITDDWKGITTKTSVPSAPACGSGCPINVHWHIQKDYLGGWVAKVTIINRSSKEVKDWFAGFQFPSLKDLLQVYSVQSVNDSSSLLLYGFSTYNDWLLGTSSNKKGNIQSEVQFSKGSHNNTLISANGFPMRVFFNGDECDMPEFIPISASHSITLPSLAMKLLYLLCFQVIVSA